MEKPIRLRGHHLETIARDLRRDEDMSLRKIGEYDYEVYFKKSEEFYSPDHERNTFEVYSRLFRENPLVELVDTPDDICKSCPYLMKEKGAECKNLYVGTGFAGETPERKTQIIKEGDAKAIRGLGFNIGNIVRFSEVFRRIMNRDYLCFGFHDLESFRRKLPEVLHPKLVKLYHQK